MNRFLSILFFITLDVSCSSHSNEETNYKTQPEIETTAEQFPCGKIIPSIFTNGDATLSYSAYLPVAYSLNKKWPVLVLFDAQARSTLPLDLYKENAERFGYILMCSNDSRNGNSPELTNKIIASIMLEAMNRFNVDTSRIYSGGFSGGARVATLFAMRNPTVKGVIGVSGGLPGNELPGHQFRFIGITGKEDFNYKELTQLDLNLSKQKFPHALLIHNGKHDWCPPILINYSMMLFESDAMRNKSIPVNKDLLNENEKSGLEEVNNLEDAQRFTDASMKLDFILECNRGLIESGQILNKRDRLEQTATWKKQSTQIKEFSKEEETSVSNYVQAIGHPLNWWEGEINKIRMQINSVPGSEHSYMLKRVLAGISIQCYSYTQQLINTADMQKISYIISLYKLVDPDNKDPWFFSAILAARNGNNEAAVHDLSVSIEKGFDDRTKLLNEAAFRQLQSLPSFTSLLSKIPAR